MCIIGNSLTEQMYRQESARQKAREDWAYHDEMRKILKEQSEVNVLKPSKDQEALND